ncbi:MAG: inositol monophosphatase, partial [Caulobacteraceae bacterium]
MARSALLTVMVNAAIKAGKSLSRDFNEVENLQVSRKGPADFVSKADIRAEQIVFDELRKARPTYAFLMEE